MALSTHDGSPEGESESGRQRPNEDQTYGDDAEVERSVDGAGGQQAQTVVRRLPRDVAPPIDALAARQESEIGKIEKTLSGKPTTGLTPSGGSFGGEL